VIWCCALGNQILTFQDTVVSSFFKVKIPKKFLLKCLDTAAKIFNTFKLSRNLLHVHKSF